MRIPVLRSQAEATSEAPGRRITARMNAAPFIEAQLRRGEVFSEIAGQVSEYALVRANALAEVEYNEAMVAAQEEMNELRRSLRDTPDIYNVFREDGTGLWQESVNDVRSRLADGLSRRDLQAQFNARFDQAEVSARFQLRDEIDTRIQQRAAAAQARRLEQLVLQASNPDNDISALSFLLTGADAELASNVANGIITPEMRLIVNSQVANAVATNTTQAFVSDNPNRALQLAAAIDLQDEVERGELTTQQAAQLSGLDEGAAYTLATLQLLPRGQAIEILYSALGRATRFADERRQNEQRADAQLQTRVTEIYNNSFAFDPAKPYNINQVSAYSPVVASRLREIYGDGVNGVYTGSQVLDVVQSTLEFQGLTPSQREALRQHANPDSPSPFAQSSVPNVYSELLLDAINGNLSLDRLNAERASLSISDWQVLANRIASEADDTQRGILRLVDATFSYNRQTAVTNDAQVEAQAAALDVERDFLAEALRRQQAGSPMTTVEQRDFVDRLVQQRQVVFRQNLAIQLQEFIDAQPTLPPLSRGNELRDLDAWFDSLSDSDRRTQETNYRRWRARINEYMNMMGGN